MNITLCSMDLVYDHYVLLVEMSDGSFATFACPWGDPMGINKRQWQWLTKQDIQRKISDFNWERRCATGEALHQRKVQTLGQDYASRGY